MRLLIVTWLFEPHATPRAIRWKTVARELVRLGCQVDLVTSRGAGESEFEILGGVHVYRCGGSKGTQLASFAKGSSGKSALAATLRRLHQATWKKLYWPDKACLWARPAIRTCERLLAKHKYDGLITVALPFTAHLVGYRLKKNHPELPWLADVGDPFSCQDASAPNNIALHGQRNRAWEGKIFQHADRVAVTNEAMVGIYEQLFPGSQGGDQGKVAVIPPVLGADVSKPAVLLPRTGPKRLLFLGTLYRNIRNPTGLLTAFEQLQKQSKGAYELHLVGDLNDCAELVAAFAKRMGDSLVVQPSQARAQAMRLLAEAEFVVNIGNTTPFQLPSKLVEYAAMGKHIVNFTNCNQDSSALFLKNYPGAIHMPQSDSLNSQEICRLREFLEAPPTFASEEMEPWLTQFSARAVATSYLTNLGLDRSLRRAA
jgi:hypothetical protein